MKINDRRWVVTGAGSGMGRALTLEMVRRGGHVAMVDLHEEAMAETRALAGDAASRLSMHVMNIADRAACEALPGAVVAHHGYVDGLVNMAGIIQPFIPVNELDYERIERVMQVNFYGALYLSKAFLPLLLQRPEGHLVNVSSMGGFIPFPGQTIYGASKAALKLLTEGLYAELQATNVRVTVVLPGAVNTNITDNSGVKRPGGASTQKGANMALPAAVAARIIADGIERNRYRVLVGRDARLMDLLYRLNPARATRFIARQMSKLVQ